jgi:hypothetical protein
MATLSYVSGAGANDYVALIVAPAFELETSSNSEVEASQTEIHSRLLRALRRDAPLPATGVQFEVPGGASQLAGSLRDAAGMIPQGVTVTVTMPDGTVLDQATDPQAQGRVVLMGNGSLTDMLISNPQAGNWTIQVEIEAPETSDEFQFFISTIPTADAQDTIASTLETMLQPAARDQLRAELGDSWGCTLCKWGCYVIAGAIAVVAAGLLAGGTIATDGAPVGMLTLYLLSYGVVVSLETAAGLIAGAASALVLGIATIAAYICYWAHVCSSAPSSEVTWSGYQQVLNTGMSSGPSAAVFSGQLYVFHQGKGNNGQLWYNVLAADGKTWSGDKQVPSTGISSSPSAAVFNNQLYVFHQGKGNSGQLWYNILSPDGITWIGDQQVPNTGISSSPSAAVFQGQIYVFHQGKGNNGQLWYNVLSHEGISWAGDKQVPSTGISSGPSAVVSNNQLYVFRQGKGNNGQLWYNVLAADGITWAGDKQVPNTGMSSDPSAVVFSNQLYVFHQGEGKDGKLWYNILSPTSTTWVGDQQVSRAGISDHPSAVVFEAGVFKGQICCFHQGKGNDGQLWYDLTT